MSQLTLVLFGPFQVVLNGQPATGFESAKVKALLAFLAVESDRPHSREALADLFWPDYPGRSALTNLRSALANLRHAIGDRDSDPPFLLISRSAIQFNRRADYTLDVDGLRVGPTASADRLAQAAALFRGPFLEGLALDDCPAFEEWLRLQRERTRLLALTVHHRLAEHHLAAGAWDDALTAARRALALEPWDEAAHRLAMRALADAGQRGLALAQFETCRDALLAELGVAPSAETLSLAAALRHDDPTAAEPPAPGPPPFKGLAFFDEGDAGLFFGRTALTAQLVDLVLACVAPAAGCRVIAVTGASGSGKSSIVRAGLLPALRRSADGDPPAHDAPFGDAVCVLTPTAHPTAALARALARAPGADGRPLADDLLRDPGSLDRAAARRARDCGSPHLLLVVDQFEELFTLCRDESERRAFIDALLCAADAPGPTVVVLTLRADFYAQCAPYGNLRRALCRRQLYIGAMTEAEMRQAIEGPAQRGGWLFEPGVVDLLLSEVGTSPGALPLLSHALLETWQRRSGRTLTVAGYRATGGVDGALAQSAEATYTRLASPQRALARNIFLRLTAIGTPTGDGDDVPFFTRRRAALSELLPDGADREAARAVLTGLADARLITLGQDSAEVAHEALIGAWGRLRGWLEDNQAGLRLHRHLTEAAQEWQRLDNDSATLYRGARLAQALEWSAVHGGDLNQLERVFLDASRGAADAEAAAEAARQSRELQAAQALAEAQRRRAEAEQQRAAAQTQAAAKLRRRAWALAVAATALVALLVAALSLGQARQSQAQLATSRELAAAAVSSVAADPERSVLLSLHALTVADTLEARNALRQALPALHSVRVIHAHGTGGAPGVDYSPDGKQLATIGWDGTAKLWDVQTGALVRDLAGTPGVVGNDIAISPDGRLAAASWFTHVLVWDAATGAVRRRLDGQSAEQPITGRIVFSPDSTRLVVTNFDGRPVVWDVAGGQEPLALVGHTGTPDAAAFSPDGRLLATCDDHGIVKAWDAATGAERASLVHGGWVHGLAFSPNGDRLVAAGEDGRVVVWATADWQIVLSLPGRTGMYNVVFTPDGERLVTVHQDGSAAVWDAATGQPLLTLAGHVSTVIDVAASPDNIHVVTSGYDSTVRVWDIRPGREMLTVSAHAGPAYATAYSPDGTRLATAGADGTARLWDPATGLLALSLFPDAAVPGFTGIAFSADGRHVAAGGVDGSVLVGDAATGRTLLTLAGHSNMVWGLAFSPDGTRLATTSWDLTVRVWDTADGRELARFSGFSDLVFGVMFSPDGTRLYAGGGWEVREWDVATGAELRTFSGEDLNVYGAALSPDGSLLAIGLQDGSTTLWDVATGTLRHRLTGHGGIVLRLAFSADGRRLVTASFDKYAKVWDVPTGEEIATLYGNGGNVFAAALSPDGTRVATAGGDGTLRLYTLDIGELTETARARVTRGLSAEECRRFLHVATCPSEE